MISKAGTIIDASFVEVPRQRNRPEENAEIKAGQVPTAWQDQPHKLSQKDLQARWTKKNEVSYFGYKNHVKADADAALITDYFVTDAAVHDSQVLAELTGPQNKGENLFADCAYKSAKIDEQLAKWGVKIGFTKKGRGTVP